MLNPLPRDWVQPVKFRLPGAIRIVSSIILLSVGISSGSVFLQVFFIVPALWAMLEQIRNES